MAIIQSTCSSQMTINRQDNGLNHNNVESVISDETVIGFIRVTSEVVISAVQHVVSFQSSRCHTPGDMERGEGLELSLRKEGTTIDEKQCCKRMIHLTIQNTYCLSSIVSP